MDNRRSSFEFEDLLACGRGDLFAECPQLPLPPMLMFDRISEIAEMGGSMARAWCGRCSTYGRPVVFPASRAIR
jgi:hypothetical protein